MCTFQKVAEQINHTLLLTFAKIYKKMTTLEATPVSNDTPIEFKGNYATTMGLNGTIEKDNNQYHFRGSVILAWPMTGYVKMAGLMMNETYAEYNSEIEDIGMEILNTTIGNSKPELSHLGIKVQMSLPTGFIGPEKIMQNGKNVFRKVQTFQTESGKVTMLINFLIDS